MNNKFKVKKSDKYGFGNQYNHIITRGRTSFLRMVGNYPYYSIMTVTASENDGSFCVCNDKNKLHESASQLGLEWNVQPYVDKDKSRREFIMICSFTVNPGEEHKDFDELERLIERFFEIFDTSACQEQKQKP